MRDFISFIYLSIYRYLYIFKTNPKIFVSGPRPVGLDIAGIQDLLEDKYDNDEVEKDRRGIDVVMYPPEEASGAISDCDSDDSDSPECNINKLPPRLLAAGGEVSLRGSGKVGLDRAGVLQALEDLTESEDDSSDEDDVSESDENNVDDGNSRQKRVVFVDPVYGHFDEMNLDGSSDDEATPSAPPKRSRTEELHPTPGTRARVPVRGAALVARATAKHTKERWVCQPPPQPPARGRGTSSIASTSGTPARGRGASAPAKGQGTSEPGTPANEPETPASEPETPALSGI